MKNYSDVPTTSQLQSFKVVELKEKLSVLGLPVGGLKADLVKRLRAHHIEENRREDVAAQYQDEEEQPEDQDERRRDMPMQGMELEEDLQRKVAIQQQLIQQQRGSHEPQEDLMVRVQQQQQMIEQQQMMMERQRQADTERRMEADRHKPMSFRESMEQQAQQPPMGPVPPVGVAVPLPAPQQPPPTSRVPPIQVVQPTSLGQQPPPPAPPQLHSEPHSSQPMMRREPPPPSQPQSSGVQAALLALSGQGPQKSATPKHSEPEPVGPPMRGQGPPPGQQSHTDWGRESGRQPGPPPRSLMDMAPKPPPNMDIGPPREHGMDRGIPPQGIPHSQGMDRQGIMQSQGMDRGMPMERGMPPQGMDRGMPPGSVPQSQSNMPPHSQPPPMSMPRQMPPPPPREQMGGPPQGPPQRPPLPVLPQLQHQVPPQGPPMQRPPPGPPPGMVRPPQGPPMQRPPPGGPDQGGQPPVPSLMNLQPRPPGQMPLQKPPQPDSVKHEPKSESDRPEEPKGPHSKEMKLAPALEKVLAFKDVRAQEVGVDPDDLDQDDDYDDRDREDPMEAELDALMTMVDADDDVMPVMPPSHDKESKNRRRKKKKKTKKTRQVLKPVLDPLPELEKADADIEYVPEQLELDPTDPNYYTFAKIFEAFKIAEPEKPKEPVKAEEKKEEPKKIEEPKGIFDEDDDEDDNTYKRDDAEDDTPKLSKKKLKKLTRLSVAQLKQLVTRPDVVEMHDVTAKDPRLLVHLKATRNSVAVPRHWCFKRKYLQGKRGIEKPPFELPDFIKSTGIQEMREALAEKEDQKNLKAKMREKVRPKLGKIDIDYQKLHDAFFRFQTKPKMTIHGDLYYEGKEFETRLKEKKPGNISDDLMVALGMPVGAGAEKTPPPWLIAMQRYGMPPSYPNLKIPGLNAPIPETCSFGYHAGGWGKPPVDENGKPLYGDVFGTQSSEFVTKVEEEEIDNTLWGELESESEEESEEEDESDAEPDEAGLVTPAEGLVTPSGITSIPVGVETPDMIELRKKRIEDAMDQGGETPALYTILPEKKSAVGQAMMGSAHIYDVSAVQQVPGKKSEKTVTEGVEVVLNPEELDLDTAAMQAKYDQTLKEQQSQIEKEDLSDMVAEHAAKQKKRKKQQDSGKQSKKYKEFKF